MEITITEKKENPLLKRKEMTCLVSYEKETPKRKDIVAELAAQLGADEKTVVVHKVTQEYGKKEAKCAVKVYDSVTDMQSIEPEYMRVRHGEPKKEKVKPVEGEAKEKK